MHDPRQRGYRNGDGLEAAPIKNREYSLDTRNKIVTLDEVLLRAGGGMQWVRGSFDPLLAADARRIAGWKRPGAPLAVVLVDPPEPLLPAHARAELVAGLSDVDYVVLGGRAPKDEEVLDLDASSGREDFMRRVRARCAPSGEFWW
jgi:hypothetical protein